MTLQSASTAEVAQARADAEAKRRRRQFNPGRFAAWTAMVLILALTVFPFLWMIRTAFSTTRSLASNPGSLLPVDFTFGAFQRVLGLSTVEQAVAEGGSGASVNFWRYLGNSFIYSSLTTIGQVIFCSMAAYAFARLRWPGRDQVFALFLTALLVPPIFTSLPNFITVKSLGWLNTWPGMLAPGLLMTPFAIFFMRQFFLGINKEIEESAAIDGAGKWRIFFQIVVPMSSAPIATLSILTFIGTWNDYFWPLLVGSDDRVRVLNVALGVFRSQTPQGAPDWAGLMAATLVAAIPVLLLFFAAGKKVVNSIGYSGMK